MHDILIKHHAPRGPDHPANNFIQDQTDFKSDIFMYLAKAWNVTVKKFVRGNFPFLDCCPIGAPSRN